MYIDCESCPARRRACDGCMMNVLFTAPSSADVPHSGDAEQRHSLMAADLEIVSAVDTFTDALMVSSADARSAKLGIGAVQPDIQRPNLRILRAG